MNWTIQQVVIMKLSKKWTWHNTLTLQTPMGSVYFVHQQSSNVLQVCSAVSMNVVQAHYHTKACIHYTSSPERLMWAMNTGCLIDKNHLAFQDLNKAKFYLNDLYKETEKNHKND